MDLKLEYETFSAKPSESLSDLHCYKNLLNELSNDGVNLTKHDINVGFINSFPEKSLSFSQGLRNSNHTQTLDLADIYDRFIYEDNLIQRRYYENKKPLIMTPSTIRLVAETFDWDEEEVSDDEEMTQVKILMALANDEFLVGKNHARSDEWIDITMRKRHHLDNKLPNFNTGRILVSESQVVNESLKPTKASNDPESSKNSESKSLTPLPPLKNLQRASSNSAVLSLTYQDHSPRRML
nr:retrovirus-related Pol polyprotein from transposon TNT 1-94 [Tanacetum cinerariifolium]GEZ80628.1 retrovirus-related Pol polyprotein from transposon TNT 1-94 [Tanacetum cinerariifolium]